MFLRYLAATGFAIMLLSIPSAAQQPYPPTTDHAPPAWFVDVASKAGILVRNVNASVESKRYIIEATGSVVAILDYDNDGWPDIRLKFWTRKLPGASSQGPRREQRLPVESHVVM
jgi:enediyne biosynthesis protein E4